MPRLHARRLDSITADELARILAELRAEGLSERSCSLILAVLGRVYKFAARRLGWGGRNPVELLERHERPKPSQDRKRTYFDGGELEQTLAAAAEPWRTLFLTLAVTGARISEALALRWQDIHLDTESPSVTITSQVDRHGNATPLKTAGSARTIPIPERLATVLRQHAARSTTPGEWAFGSSGGRPLSQRNVARALRVAQTAARTPDGRPTFPALHELDKPDRGAVPGLHAFRHTAASRLIHAGVPLEDTARMLGHASSQVTATIYSHELADADRAAVQRGRLDAAFTDALDA